MWVLELGTGATALVFVVTRGPKSNTKTTCSSASRCQSGSAHTAQLANPAETHARARRQTRRAGHQAPTMDSIPVHTRAAGERLWSDGFARATACAHPRGSQQANTSSNARRPRLARTARAGTLPSNAPGPRLWRRGRSQSRADEATAEEATADAKVEADGGRQQGGRQRHGGVSVSCAQEQWQ